MKIEKVKIEEIIPYKNNAKLHPRNQIEQIKASILEFGNNDPIAIDENNIVIEGHGRLIALKELEYKEIECIRLSHLTEEQKRAYILVHNKLTMNTGFDYDILQAELKEIETLDMSQFDFEEFSLEIPDDYEDSQEDTRIQQTYLKYKNKEIPLTEDEEYLLDKILNDYINENGVLYGFINHILGE